MKRALTMLFITLIVAACQSGTPTPVPTTAPEPTSAVAKTTPQPSTSVTSAPEKIYPPRPTATAYKAKSAAARTYANPDYGLTLKYPTGWQAIPPDQGSDVLTWFVNSDGSVQVMALTGTQAPDQSLEDLAAEIRDSLTNGLGSVKLLGDGALTLDDGRDAWGSVLTAKRDDGAALKINVTVATYNGRAIVLVAFGAPVDYDDNADDLQQLIGALQLAQPQLSGIDRDQALVLAGGESRNPREYDPATTHGSGNKLIFSGLVALDRDLQLIPDLASSWDITDGTTYTFHIRSDARFHNGKPMTAQDVVYSWERAADPKTNSDTVLTYLSDIVGVKERYEGQADHIRGVKIIDAQTLQVTIDAPKPYFLLKLTYPVAFVVDRQNAESGDEWWRSPNGTGPYRLARWESFKSILYERNDDYYLEPSKIANIMVQLFTGVGLRLYENGEIDVTGVGLSDVPRFEDPKEPLHDQLLSGVSLCTGMIIFDVTKPPFDDLKVRQAFSLAFDREKYIDVVLSGIGLPAVGPFPPGLPGYDTTLAGLTYDPVRARQLLSESKYAGNLPPIIYTDGGSGSDIGGDVAALAQMWQQNLGITITVENLEGDKYSDLIHAGQHGQIFSGGWCADYPDPENFADALFHTGAQQNQSNYSNPELDKILEDARVEQDTTKRIQLYQQAQRLIVADAPVLFTTHGLSYVLVKPYLQGYVLTPIDIALERYLSIDPSKMK
ncbi:MAG: peptide ABC transporter substrate-binding protein [Thermoflexales bacterium]|nr:peptide ABC transporter substrate-binding protein [Thermoflexales bacterium]